MCYSLQRIFQKKTDESPPTGQRQGVQSRGDQAGPCQEGAPRPPPTATGRRAGVERAPSNEELLLAQGVFPPHRRRGAGADSTRRAGELWICQKLEENVSVHVMLERSLGESSHLPSGSCMVPGPRRVRGPHLNNWQTP